MTFADLQSGDAICVDANVFIYHFTNHRKYGPSCTALIERIELNDLRGFTSSQCLADVAHRIMTLEAMGRLGWPVSRLAARLNTHHVEICWSRVVTARDRITPEARDALAEWCAHLGVAIAAILFVVASVAIRNCARDWESAALVDWAWRRKRRHAQVSPGLLLTSAGSWGDKRCARRKSNPSKGVTYVTQFLEAGR
jgi:predicted nucleic acid-binding protein